MRMSINIWMKQTLKRLFLPAEKNENMNFSNIYKTGGFKGRESLSGEGSGIEQTKVIRSVLPGLLREYQVRSVLDAPCGDFFWMRFMDLSDIEYIGVDIVEEAINKNNLEFAQKSRRFEVMDVVKVRPPKVDMIFCRDLLVHLSLDDGMKVIGNFMDSGSRYLLTTTFTDRLSNMYDIRIKPGEVFWRPLNLEKPPFSFDAPIKMINEGCTEGDGHYRDKSLGLWRLSDIKLQRPNEKSNT
jgi:hypothetical protein